MLCSMLEKCWRKEIGSCGGEEEWVLSSTAPLGMDPGASMVAAAVV